MNEKACVVCVRCKQRDNKPQIYDSFMEIYQQLCIRLVGVVFWYTQCNTGKRLKKHKLRH